MTTDSPVASRSRDAEKTRQALLESARSRFAHDGYAATTVRDIATDAGVNVALINRYFGSKEGLFAACLNRTVEQMEPPAESQTTFDQMVASLVARVADQSGGVKPLELLLLIRSSGDEKADEIRRATLTRYTESMAAIAGWKRDDPATEALLLRAQIAMATGFGIVLWRASTELGPLASASAADLSGPVGDVVTALLR
ncbi:TetR family transcriptional regulator [Frondihabitans sp. PhB188]|uniref:TetR/AcrR family transcriptional regulator n=1 Tax=Frondihabitans sp. PhB188 TaxID=2485200 RepID=UPI000F9FD5FC|nr:TetR/AcrR family transcriptional regulator [Frondihabitans sp. PhB188]ROQ38693.1 TetR family transcriptional regulator [Frondihabitans sp. PhB188]